MSGVNGNDQANVRGVPYTIDSNKLLSAVRAAKDEARTRSARYDGLCKEYTAEWWRRLWQGVRWTATLVFLVPMLTALWVWIGFGMYSDPAPSWFIKLILSLEAIVLFGFLGNLIWGEVADTDSSSIDVVFDVVDTVIRGMLMLHVLIAALPVVMLAVCFGKLQRVWRGAELATIKEDAREVYDHLMTPRLQTAQLLNEAIPMLNALAVITDTSPAVRRLVPPGYQFSNVKKCQAARDDLWMAVSDMQGLLAESHVSSKDAIKWWERAIDTAKKALVIDDRRVAQIMLAEIKEGK